MSPATRQTASEETQELWRRLNQLSSECGITVAKRETGHFYHGPNPSSGVGVYATSRGVEFNLEQLRISDPVWTDNFVHRLSSIRGKAITAKDYPNLPVSVFLNDWGTAKDSIFTPFFHRLMA